MEKLIRRVASNEITVEGKTLRQYVVEIVDHRVVDYYCFQEELPFTEWLEGKIELRKDENGFLQAYLNNKLL
jgi:hypothetical protein